MLRPFRGVDKIRENNALLRKRPIWDEWPVLEANTDSYSKWRHWIERLYLDRKRYGLETRWSTEEEELDKAAVCWALRHRLVQYDRAQAWDGLGKFSHRSDLLARYVWDLPYQWQRRDVRDSGRPYILGEGANLALLQRIEPASGVEAYRDF